MARIEFTGFVQKHEGNRPWEIAENHRREVDGKWITESTTYHRCWLPRDLDSLPEGQLVKVVGKQITEPKKGDYPPSVVVRIQSVTDKDGNPIQPAVPEPWEPATTGDPDDDQEPF